VLAVVADVEDDAAADDAVVAEAVVSTVDDAGIDETTSEDTTGVDRRADEGVDATGTDTEEGLEVRLATEVTASASVVLSIEFTVTVCSGGSEVSG
jgi:hypothetical protein